MSAILPYRAAIESMIRLLLCMCTISFVFANSANAQPGKLQGFYNILTSGSGMDSEGFDRSVVSGVLFFDSLSQRFYINGHSASMETRMMCGLSKSDSESYGAWKRSACDRRFIRRTDDEFIYVSGAYEYLSDLTIRFKVDGSPEFNSVEGFTNIDASVVMLPLHPSTGVNLVVGVKASTAAMGNSALGVYDWNAKIAELPSSRHSIGGWWRSYSVGIEKGTMDLGATDYTSSGNGSKIKSIFKCRSAANGCTIGAKQIAKSSVTFPEGGDLSVAAWGGLSVHGKKNTVLPGLVSSDKQLIVVAEENSKSGRQGLTLMTRQGEGLSNASVIGEYNALALEEFLSSDGRIRNAVVEGPLELDGTNWAFGPATDSSVIRDECSGDRENCYVSVSNFSAVGTAGGDYTIGNTGEMVMSGIAIDGNPRLFKGNISSDGQFIVLRRVRNNISCDFFCSGTQSIRSLIIAVRRSE